MTFSIALLLVLLLFLVVTLLREWLPNEVAAFVVLLVLVYGGYVTVEQAFAGFASPAVIAIFSIFFISGALRQTGVADGVGRKIAQWSGGSEVTLLIALMLMAAAMSAFMNNVAAVAMLMPAVASIAAHSGTSPSRLYIPLSFGVLLGGITTLVGTPPNLLASQVLAEHGRVPLDLFDITPIGIAIVLAGIAYMVIIGRHLLPSTVEARRHRDVGGLTNAYRIEERLTSIRVPAGSNLDGLSLRETRLGTALDVAVVAVQRGKKKILAPLPDFRLEADDLLLVDGSFADLQQLLGMQGVAVREVEPGRLDQVARKVEGVVVALPAGSGLVGKSLRELHFRDRFGVLVVGLRRGAELVREELGRRILRQTDEILALGTPEQIAALSSQKGLRVVAEGQSLQDLIQERFFVLKVPAASALSGRTIRESRLGELAGLTVLGIVRGGQALLAMPGDEKILADDELLVAGEPRRIVDLGELGELALDAHTPITQLESESVKVSEVVVAPRSAAAGSSLRQLQFRDRYGVQVLALWRGGQAIYKELANIPLRFGDALLIHGAKTNIGRLAENPDFVVLSVESQPRRQSKAPVAIGALLLAIGLVVADLAPMHLAAFTGAMLCVVTGTFTMQEAYRSIEWRAVYVVAAVWPLGLAMTSSGAAHWLAEVLLGIGAELGAYAFLALLIVLSSALSQVLDGVPAVVILGAVAVEVAAKLEVSPYPLVVGVGLAASAAFMTPFSHKASLLVVSAGGYTTRDFLRVGTPLTLLMMVLLVLLIPIFFPF